MSTLGMTLLILLLLLPLATPDDVGQPPKRDTLRNLLKIGTRGQGGCVPPGGGRCKANQACTKGGNPGTCGFQYDLCLCLRN
uniref:Conotoxin Cl9.6 n=1 Tax=Californiconus californicus TaxID=1736779 RepID=CU96_CONCL